LSFFLERRLTMAATQQQYSNATPTLYLAFERGWSEWKLAFASAPADAPRLRSVAARNTQAVLQEIAKAKRRFGLPDDAPVRCCYEAGRAGFWLHRWLVAQGLDNLVVDSASIETNRRQRRAKSDRLDAAKLVSMLLRYHGGEQKVWSVVHVPDAAAEDRRQLHRDLVELKAERTQHINRIKGLLASCGLAITTIAADFPERLAALRQWDDTPVPPALQQRLLREFARYQFVDRQVRDLDNQRARTIRTADDAATQQIQKLPGVRGIGANSAWLFVMEFFSWRALKNRKQLAALAGLTPTPYDSGGRCREQGDQQGRQPAAARHGGGDRLELVALPAAQRAESVVSAALGSGQQPAAAYWDRRLGPQAVGGAVALSGSGRGAGRGSAGGLEGEDGRAEAARGRGVAGVAGRAANETA
jgi:transposase